jgi:hypothetical protein
MMRADAAALPSFDANDRPKMRAWNARQRSIRRALSFTHLVTALKAKEWVAAAKVAVANPSVLPLLRMPVAMKLWRL